MRDGVVYIVGAGPGDPGLLTVRARELIEGADAIVYDALVAPEIIAAAADASGLKELLFVGKRGGNRSSPRQSEINELIVRLAREGKRVVRLKGGDPFVFGRGGEEAEACHDADVAYEIVPGVTAGLAAPAYAGIPVTHRGTATSVTLVTGHEDPTKGGPQTDWSALARLAASGGTVVVYMGGRSLPVVVQSLLDGGLDAHVPAATIARGTTPTQQTVTGTVETIAAEVERAGLTAPLVTVFGWAALLRDDLAWLEKRPLFRRTIVVTRAAQQASVLSLELRDLGAKVIEMPAIRVARLDTPVLRERIARLRDYGWIIFTSQNAVSFFWETLLAGGADARALAHSRIAAVGPSTAATLLERGIAVDVLPSRFVAEALLEALVARSDVAGTKVLYVTADGARDVLAQGLQKLGAEVETIAIYRSISDGRGADRLRRQLERGTVDLVTVTSASAVHAFVDLVGIEAAQRAPIASIGEITSAAARESQLHVAVEASESTIQGLVSAIRDWT